VNKPIGRLPASPTQRIDRGKTLSFTYEGKKFNGLCGDTVATALYAGGVRIFSRSIKYHRPRGLYSLDGECSNCLMEIDGLPNVRAETTLLREGMAVKAQNVAGSADLDLWGIMDKLDWAMPAGFYYRAFHKPYDMWPFFLRRIRQAAGIGRIDPNWEPGPREQLFLNSDVCVVGGGPAGISAALAAADYGMRVVLLEARPWLGGFYDWRIREYEPGLPLYKRAGEMAAQIDERPNVRLFTHTFVNGLWGDNLVTAFQVGGPDDPFEEQYIEIRAGSVVVATGTIERPLLFENNERPGVMQVGCAHRLARTFGLLPGKAAVFSVGQNLGLEAAVDLSDLGLKVLCVADCRIEGHDPELVEALSERKIPFRPGWAVSRAEEDRTLSEVLLTSLDGANKERFKSDLLVASAGRTPVNGILSLGQAKLAYDRFTNFFLPEEVPTGLHAAGRLLGYNDPAAIEASGRLAGVASAIDNGASAYKEHREAQERLARSQGPYRGSKHLLPTGNGDRNKSFVCFDEDATVKHIAQACQHGFDTPELAKRFTATGTGPGQGGIPGHNLPLVMSQFRGEEPEAVQPTTVRPPLVPTLMATYAGPKHDVFKRTPLHEVQERAGAVFRRVGVWKRARYFSEDLASRAEIARVHSGVGLIDVSTLGKFRIFGPDSYKALERVYVGDMTKVREDRVKYVAMCNEDGCLIDDGVVVKLAENDYYLTTSTGRAGATIEWFRFQTRYDGWEYHMVNQTDTLAAVNLAGPLAREVLQKLTDEDVSNEAFPFSGCRELRLALEIPVRVMRLGFVGELSYEIHVPASRAVSLWNRIIEAGQ
jgi:sarcosine oxidase subunit alpha